MEGRASWGYEDQNLQHRTKWSCGLPLTGLGAGSCGCGFGDYPHFSKLFKKMYGISPQEFRDKQRNNWTTDE
ncbi:helix-turn-helix domain-containing protein [Paenibacillus pectinilyticus]|uniref:helix-turn-helix domain-containing protein n=1 Tax=Paenibacillus pectinilyticus TaxID=512399 RepID=UPI00114D131E